LKVVIFAGGLGTRLTEETQLKPKPLVEACGKPLLWHIMQNYSSYGFKEFVILVGYKGDMIREYFANFWMYKSDITFNLLSSDSHVHETRGMPWKVSIVETGINTSTGSRLAKIKNIINEDFLLTYGDGIADIDLKALLNFHSTSGRLATMSTTRAVSRFGLVEIDESGLVQRFQEKPKINDWINIGYFVFEDKIFDYLDEDSILEQGPLRRLAEENQLGGYRHEGFWQPMDTQREAWLLNSLWSSNDAPWKIW
jgi:glucose-1-phosphate cytidylyltransferase